MMQTQAWVTALKRALRAQGLTYRDVAVALDLSVASVKRLLAQGRLTLDRFECICRLIGIEPAEIARRVDAESRRMQQLSVAQERALVSDPGLLLVAFLVVNGWNYRQILDHYRYTEVELIHALARLDRLGMIELLPQNRIRLQTAPNFAWRSRGPVQAFFRDRLLDEYLTDGFDGPGESLLILSGMLSEDSARSFGERLRKLAGEFNAVLDDDRALPADVRQAYTAVLAVRSWRPSVFESFRKPKRASHRG